MKRSSALRLSRGADLLLYCSVGALVLAVYLATAAPSIIWAHDGTDGGDFVTAAATGRVPHPPGFPVYLTLSRVVVTVTRVTTSGDPARVMNKLSAVMATGTVLLVALTARVRDSSRVRDGSRWAAGVAAITLALAPWFWSQALITEVYTTAAFFVALAILLAELTTEKPSYASFAPGIAFGLAMSVHPLAGFAGPFLLPQRRRAWLWFGGGVLIGLVPYVLLPLWGPWPQPWGDLSSVGGWWRYVTAQFYWGNAFALPLSQWPRRWAAWLVLTFRQFSPPGVVLVGVGFAQIWKGDRARALGLAFSLSVGTIYAIGYNTGDSWVYLVPLMPLLAYVLAVGLQYVLTLGSQPVLVGLLALALPALLLLNWSGMDVSRDYRATAWLERMLNDAPEGAALITEEDPHIFALWYATEVLNRRQDLLVVDRRLWGFEPYVEFLRRRSEEMIPMRLSELARYRSLCEVGTGGMSCR